MAGVLESKIKHVAVVHDWLTGMRGGEVVLEAILDMFPDADLYTLLYNRGSVSRKISERKIYTSFIDHLPFKKSKYRHYLPLFPAAVEKFDFHGYDLVISSSHCAARGVIVPPGIPHISFFHSPMRYVWDMYHDYFPDKGIVNRAIIPFFANYLRMWDVSAAPSVDGYVSNSKFVGMRIRRFYGKEAHVVFPPCIEDHRQVPAISRSGDFYLVVSAMVPYKRVDLAVEAFRGLDVKLVIAGDGPELKKLKKNAPENVEFTGKCPRESLEKYYSTARGLIFPGLEDFGIVPVEAQSFGCPVIAYAKGGALETVVNGKTGVYFYEQTADAIREGVLKNEKIKYSRKDFQKNISRFTYGAFRKNFSKEIELMLREYRN